MEHLYWIVQDHILATRYDRRTIRNLYVYGRPVQCGKLSAGMNATCQLTLQSRQRERPPRPRAAWRRLPTLASFSFNTQCLCKCTCRESWRLPYDISLSLRFTFCEQIIGRSRPTLVLTFRRPSFMVADAKLTSWVAYKIYILEY